MPFDQYEVEFDSLLNQAIDFAGMAGDVVVVSIPDYGVTPFGSSNVEIIAEELDMYNDYAMQRCQERGIPFVDVTTVSRMLGSSSGALTFDNLHPSGYQYSLWVNEILPVVETLLSE